MSLSRSSSLNVSLPQARTARGGRYGSVQCSPKEVFRTLCLRRISRGSPLRPIRLVRSRRIQKRLLAEKSLTWKTAVEMALAMEVAVKQTNNFRNTPADSGIHYVRSPHPLKATKPKRTCFRCSEDHIP